MSELKSKPLQTVRDLLNFTEDRDGKGIKVTAHGKDLTLQPECFSVAKPEQKLNSKAKPKVTFASKEVESSSSSASAVALGDL